MEIDQKLRLVNDIKSLICDFVELCTEEHLSQTTNPDSVEKWYLIDKKLNLLGDL